MLQLRGVGEDLRRIVRKVNVSVGPLQVFIYLFIYIFIYLFIYLFIYTLFKVDLHITLQ